MYRFLTFPKEGNTNEKAHPILTEAILNADEIWWASAYLTSWPLPKDCIPNNNCSICKIVIGSDFGITRKAALVDLYKWGKPCSADLFINDTQGFHPKVLLWRQGNRHYVFAGSSNLSVAAWSSNIELNIRIPIKKMDFEVLTEWFEDYVIGASQRLDPSTIKSYSESKRTGKRSKKVLAEIDYRIKKLRSVDLSGPKKQLKVYNRNKSAFVKAVKACAKSRITNMDFYNTMTELLKGTWRGNSALISMNCKHEDWKETCSGLTDIFTARKNERDRVVKKVIDSLQSSGNKTRGTWLSEILCHHYPLEFPLIDDPVKEWIRESKIENLYGIPTGYQYIRISHIMRTFLKDSKDKFRNFMEMDHAIWRRQYFKNG